MRANRLKSPLVAAKISLSRVSVFMVSEGAEFRKAKTDADKFVIVLEGIIKTGRNTDRVLESFSQSLRL